MCLLSLAVTASLCRLESPFLWNCKQVTLLYPLLGPRQLDYRLRTSILHELRGAEFPTWRLAPLVCVCPLRSPALTFPLCHWSPRMAFSLFGSVLVQGTPHS